MGDAVMKEYLSFEEVAAELKCSLMKVHQMVLEDRRLLAKRITPNGMVLEPCGNDGVLPYELNFCSHVSNEGEITSDVYTSQADGETVVTRVLHVGYLRIERAELARIILSGVVLESEKIDSAMQYALDETGDAGGGSPQTPAAPVAQPKQRAQEETILKLLRGNNYDPLKLPISSKGMPGVKAEIKAIAQKLHPKLFSDSSFVKAWQRLREGAEIKDNK
jgi:hypothetical protein